MLGVEPRQLDEQERVARAPRGRCWRSGAGRNSAAWPSAPRPRARAVVGAERPEPELRQHLVAAGAAHLRRKRSSASPSESPGGHAVAMTRRPGVDGAQQIREQRQRVLVGPVQIVEQHHQRPVRCVTRSTRRLTTAKARSRSTSIGSGPGGLAGGQLAQHRKEARQQREIVADGLGELRLLEHALLHRCARAAARRRRRPDRRRCR